MSMPLVWPCQEKEVDMMVIFKLTCYVPSWRPGLTERAAESYAMRHLGSLKPKATVIVKPGEFYYLFDMDEKSISKITLHKIPHAEVTIRRFYGIVIRVVNRGNKVATKLSWPAAKTLKWIKEQFKKQGGDEKQAEEFFTGLSLDDEDKIREFIAGELFKWEVVENE